MPITLDIKQGQVIKLPTGLYRFCQERSNNVLLLQREDTGMDLPMPEHKLEKMLGDGVAKIIDFRRSTEKQGPNDNADFGPGEEWVNEGDPSQAAVRTFEAQRARALQFYTQKWDEDGRAMLGELALQKFIDTWRVTAIQMGIEPKDKPKPKVKSEVKVKSKEPKDGYWVKPARLKHAIKNCGETGNRPLRLFRSRRGKTEKKRFCDFVETAIDKTVAFYWELRTRDYNDAYAYFSDELIGPENKRREAAGLDPLKYPKRLETIRRRINLAANYITWSQKYSKHEAHRKFKGIKKSLSAERPLELVIMDHTVFDTWTVLDTETFLPLGRPTLTVAIDVATRMILGYLVSFEPASLYSVLTTLKRVNKNKAYVKSVFPGIRGKWNAWGKPQEILVDNGWEFKSKSLQDALHDLGTDIIWAPVHTPEYKAIGERFFQTLNLMLAKKLPGTAPKPELMRKANLDPESEAIITLGDLDLLIHQTLIEVYQDKPHEGLGGIPARIWRDKIRFHKRPFIRDITALNALMGRIDDAVLTRKGIRFENMTFHDETLTSALLFDLVRYEKKRSQSDDTSASGRVKVKIKYNPADASTIQVWNRGGDAKPHYVSLPNLDEKFFNNLSFWHWKKICEFAKSEDLDFSSEEDRWSARNRLRLLWEELSGAKLLRERKDARRGLTASQGTFDNKSTNDESDMEIGDIEDAVADSSTSGMEAPSLVPDEDPSSEDDIAAHDRADDGWAAKGRTPSKKDQAKAAKTKADNKAKAAEQQAAAEERQRKGNPTGKPAGKHPKGAKPGNLASGAEWGDDEKQDQKSSPSTSDSAAAGSDGSGPKTADGVPLAGGAGWGDQD